MENKEEIVQALFKTLSLTREYSDLSSLSYVKEKGGEYVIAKWEDGYNKKICVTCDSGIAIIKDVIKSI